MSFVHYQYLDNISIRFFLKRFDDLIFEENHKFYELADYAVVMLFYL